MFLFSKMPRLALAPTRECQAEHSYPYTGEVKNDWSYSSTQVSTALLRNDYEILTEEVKQLGTPNQVHAVLQRVHSVTLLELPEKSRYSCTILL